MGKTCGSSRRLASLPWRLGCLQVFREDVQVFGKNHKSSGRTTFLTDFNGCGSSQRLICGSSGKTNFNGLAPVCDWLPECLAPWNCVPSAQRRRVSGWDIAPALGSTSASPACTSCARAGATTTRMSATNTSFPTRWEIAHPLKQSLVRPAHIYRPTRGVYLAGGAVIMVRVSGTNGYFLWPADRVWWLRFRQLVDYLIIWI